MTLKCTFIFLSLSLASGCSGIRTDSHPSVSPIDSSPAYIACMARFTDYEVDYPWFENRVDPDGHECHYDGSSTRAVFLVVSPANHSGRIVGVLYKYQGNDLSPPQDVGDKGKIFSLELPEDFFKGNFETIDNIHVRNLKMGPEP